MQRVFHYDLDDQPVENTAKALLPSAARTAAVETADQVNRHHRGVIVVIDITAIADAPSVTFTIEGKDETSGKYYTILASAAQTGTGTVVLRVYPNLTAADNLTINSILPRTWRVKVTVGNANSMTYSVGASLIL